MSDPADPVEPEPEPDPPARRRRTTLANRVVVGGGGKVVEPYDTLVLATGSRPFVPPMEGTRQQGVFVFHEIDPGTYVVELMANIKNEVLHNLFRSTSNLQAFENFLATLPQFLLKEQAPSAATATGPVPGRHGDRVPTGDGVSSNGDGSELKLDLAPVRRDTPKVGRNEPCPCGSGKKFKNCCGRVA